MAGVNRTGMPKGVSKKLDVQKYLCSYCNRHLSPSSFYSSNDPLVVIGITSICKECCKKIAMQYDTENGMYGDATQDSIRESLFRIDRPWLDHIYSNAFTVTNNKKAIGKESCVWDEYMRQLQLSKHRYDRWVDSDPYYGNQDPSQINNEQILTSQQVEAMEDYEKNRQDIIRLVGYDPFAAESDADKPLLYAQLIGYMDGEGNNDDMTRVLDSIEIVRGYLQLKKLNDMASKAFENLSTQGKTNEVRNYMDTKKKVTDIITSLAEQSCISLKHNKHAKKGENTWTGKIKKLQDINLREAEVNGFDMATCRGMRQIMDMSHESIIRALALDESEYSSMIAEQRTMIHNLTRDKETYQEICRILLRENLDLRDTLVQNQLLLPDDLKNLKDLFSPFAEEEDDESTFVYEEDEPEEDNEEDNE